MVQVRANSEAPGFEAYRALDGDSNSMWHTDWQFQNPAPPHELQIDLGERYEIGGFTYLPRPVSGVRLGPETAPERKPGGLIEDHLSLDNSLCQSQPDGRESKQDKNRRR